MIAPLLTSLIAVAAAAQLREPSRMSSENVSPQHGRSNATDDSVRLARGARRAQQQFESLRRANLPAGPGSPGGTCDLRVGRLCYWHDDGYSPPEVPEPERIASGRERLLATLAEAERRISGDEWIVGQRVRYLLDARRNTDAVAAAVDCRSTSWWCAALAGLALHRASEFARADSAFAVALRGMPTDQRCRWTDISLYLDGRPGRRYRDLPCSEREHFERRFWWLAQPLYGLAANDLRTEFLARRTMSRLEQQARSAYDMSWGADVEELLMRFGWPTWWTRDHSTSLSVASAPSVVGHEPTPSFFFHPTASLLERDAWDANEQDWEPRAKLPGARYAPAYAASFSDLRTQVAVFRRGDSALVVVAYEQPTDSLFSNGVSEAALAVGHDERTPMTVVSHRPRPDRREPLAVRAAWKPLLLSVEVKSARRGVARARFGIRPNDARTGRLALSDLLLYRGVDGSEGSLDDLTRHALGTSAVVSGGRVGLYWEMYGVRPSGEALSVTLSVERVSAGWRRRAAERLGLAQRATPLSVRWKEVPKRDSGIANRAIVIDVAHLPTGRYRMQLTVAADDGSTATSERLVELIPPR